MRAPFAVAFLIVAGVLLGLLPEHMSVLLFRTMIVLLAATGVLLVGSLAVQERLAGHAQSALSYWRRRTFQPGQIGRHLVQDVRAGRRNQLEELLPQYSPEMLIGKKRDEAQTERRSRPSVIG